MSQREFTSATAYDYDRRSPLRWIISHSLPQNGLMTHNQH